jgi:putative effector of murein hydrolase LrgA (UPF0299 family)
MIAALALILFCQLAGEAVARGSGLPIPGPVLGMALLVALLLLRDRVATLPTFLRDGSVERTGRGLLSHLSLLFVPAGVGVVQNLDVLASSGLALAVALVVSTLLAMLAAVATFRLVARVTERG